MRVPYALLASGTFVQGFLIATILFGMYNASMGKYLFKCCQDHFLTHAVRSGVRSLWASGGNAYQCVTFALLLVSSACCRCLALTVVLQC
jgi:hypothetical protein